MTTLLLLLFQALVVEIFTHHGGPCDRQRTEGDGGLVAVLLEPLEEFGREILDQAGEGLGERLHLLLRAAPVIALRQQLQPAEAGNDHLAHHVLRPVGEGRFFGRFLRGARLD
jgi:hypothetical protein